MFFIYIIQFSKDFTMKSPPKALLYRFPDDLHTYIVYSIQFVNVLELPKNKNKIKMLIYWKSQMLAYMYMAYMYM